MNEPMTPEELKACRERAEAATPGPWEVSRRDDVMGGFDYFVEAGPLCVAVAAEDARPTRGMGAKRDAAFIAAAREDVPRLLATIDKLRERAERAEAIAATASRNFAAEVARAQRETARGPVPGEWFVDETDGDVLKVVTADGIMLSAVVHTRGGATYAIEVSRNQWELDTLSNRRRRMLDGEVPPVAPQHGPPRRSPVAGWEAGRGEGDWLLLKLPPLRVEAYDADLAEERSFTLFAEDTVDHCCAEVAVGSGFESRDAMLFAAEDELFKIADAINALRGGR